MEAPLLKLQEEGRRGGGAMRFGIGADGEVLRKLRDARRRRPRGDSVWADGVPCKPMRLEPRSSSFALFFTYSINLVNLF